MPHWLIKSALHRVISWLPGSHRLNGMLQTHVTRSTALTAMAFEDKIKESQRHLDAFRSQRPEAGAFSVFELGTGWHPILPLSFYLCGAKEIWSVDIQALVRRRALQALLGWFCRAAESGRLQEWLPALHPDRLPALTRLAQRAGEETPAALLKQINIHLLILDAQQTPLGSGSVDLFESSGVLQYIPREVLRGIFQEWRRLAAPGAVMSHRVNLADQFASFDSSITPFNFLQYSPAQWRWRSSPLIWQNRLRIADYRELLQQAGFAIVNEENTTGKLEDLRRINLAAEFRHYREEDLLVLHSYLTARLAPGQPAGRSHTASASHAL